MHDPESEALVIRLSEMGESPPKVCIIDGQVRVRIASCTGRWRKVLRDYARRLDKKQKTSV
jgi:hypothetical protein